MKRNDSDIGSLPDIDAFLTKNDRKSIYGREVPLRSNHTICFQMIRKWLGTCRMHHPDCNRDLTALLPKRVIDVSGGSDCRLIEPPASAGYAPYIALSHCWGGRSLFCTTLSNYETHKECIKIEDFPNTFRDAVELTRILSVRYLWIDALCIIQGDRENKDWEEQADAVGGYYRNAVLTISAMRAPDYNAGLFHPRKSVSAALSSDLSSSNRKQIFIREAYSPSPSTTTKITGPVSERAWVLQERLLSPAVLHFTKREIVWECRTQTIFEHGSYAKPQDKETKLLLVTGERTRNNRSTPAWTMPRADRFKEWYKLVQIYSSKKLTRGDDRLPAIAGLAAKFHDMCDQSNYLAGIWSEDTLRGLLWNTADQVPPTDGLEEPSKWHAPSWSWASTRRPVNCNTHLGDCIASNPVAKIHRVDVDSENPKSYGHVYGGSLEATGILRSAIQLKIRPHTVQMRWDRRPNCANEKLWSFELGSWEVAGDVASATIVYFLLLEPLFSSGHDMTGYQRVGLAWCEWTGEKRPDIQPGGQSMRICIV
jgi:hypothetical protein